LSALNPSVLLGIEYAASVAVCLTFVITLALDNPISAALDAILLRDLNVIFDARHTSLRVRPRIWLMEIIT
jgi:hypothetical protein